MVTKVKGNGTSTFGGEIQTNNNAIVSNRPVFAATTGANQSISETTATKVEFNTKVIDTDSAFDTSNYRFTVPTGKAGYYSINSIIRVDSEVSSNLIIGIIYLYKNGAAFKRQYQYFSSNYIRSISIAMTNLMDLEVGDYLEVYGYINSVDNTGGILTQNTYSEFSGHKLTA